MPPIPYFDEMFFQMQRMVGGTVRAYVELDVAAAEQVARQDDVQDDYFEGGAGGAGPPHGGGKRGHSQYIDYLLIAKYLERMSDHATNLAGWIAYIVRGDCSFKTRPGGRTAGEMALPDLVVKEGRQPGLKGRAAGGKPPAARPTACL